MRVLIGHRGRRYRFLGVDSSTRDGSLNITVRRAGTSAFSYRWEAQAGAAEPVRVDFTPQRAKNKKITVHQSGRINFHETGESIYVEPLAVIAATTRDVANDVTILISL